MTIKEKAEKYSKENIDIDIPITKKQKEAVRWLLAQAFIAGNKHKV